MVKEFKAFLTKSNALALAVGVIIGAATGKVVSAVVDDVLMPLIGLILPAGDWREAKLIVKSAVDATGKEQVSAIQYGHLVGTILDFAIIAFVVFLITKALLRPEPAPPTPPSKECPECLETLPDAAKRCRACGAVQPEAAQA
jgi:large conductance mechanosensitive channel